MVLSLAAEFHLPEGNAGIIRGILDHLFEQVRRDVLAAGAGDQITARNHHFHGTQVDFLIAAQGAFHGGARFGECRRIQDDHVVLLPGLALLGEQVECPTKLKLRQEQESLILCY